MKSVTSTGVQPGIRLVAALLFAALSSPQPCFAFEADGLHSGMSLEDFKKSPFLVGKRVDLFSDTPKNTSFIINGHDQVEFCYGSLSFYSRWIKDPLTLLSLVQIARKSKLIDEVNNKKFGSVNDGKTYYDNIMTWVVDGGKYKLSFWSLRPVDLSELQDEDAVSAAVSFGPYPAGESMSLSQECKSSVQNGISLEKLTMAFIEDSVNPPKHGKHETAKIVVRKIVSFVTSILASASLCLPIIQPAQALENGELCEALHPQMTSKEASGLGLPLKSNQSYLRIPAVDGVSCDIWMSDDMSEIGEVHVFHDTPPLDEPEVRRNAISLVKKLTEKWGFPTQWTIPYYYKEKIKLTGGVQWTCTGAYRDGARHGVSFEIYEGMLRTTIRSYPCLGMTIPEYQNSSKTAP